MIKHVFRTSRIEVWRSLPMLNADLILRRSLYWRAPRWDSSANKRKSLVRRICTRGWWYSDLLNKPLLCCMGGLTFQILHSSVLAVWLSNSCVPLGKISHDIMTTNDAYCLSWVRRLVSRCVEMIIPAIFTSWMRACDPETQCRQYEGISCNL